MHMQNLAFYFIQSFFRGTADFILGEPTDFILWFESTALDSYHRIMIWVGCTKQPHKGLNKTTSTSLFLFPQFIYISISFFFFFPMHLLHIPRPFSFIFSFSFLRPYWVVLWGMKVKRWVRFIAQLFNS